MVDIKDSEKLEYLAYHNSLDFIKSMEDGLSSLKEDINKISFKNITLICGAMVAFDKGMINFINRMSRQVPNLCLLSEVTAENRRYTHEKITCPAICTPHLLAKEIYLSNMDIHITDEMLHLYHKKGYLRYAAKNLMMRHLDIKKSYVIAWSYYAYCYISTILANLSIREVYLWNKYYAFHHIFDQMCRERNVSVKYMEFGCIPGSVSIEMLGQQGESFPAQHISAFKNQAISISDIQNAREIIGYLKDTKLNRNVQPNTKICPYIEKILQNGKKNILYIGQNDYESGLVPYTFNARRKHSPVFNSSLEALDYLCRLNDSKKWNLFYKPHPIVETLRTEEHKYYKYGNAVVLRNVDINLIIDKVDLVITIFSQSAYVSLIRNTPVLMLGYTQLKEKDCCYEAYKKWHIEECINRALKWGYTSTQRENFCKHVAQLLKYYLYDDGMKKEYVIGKDIESLILEEVD